MRCHPLSNPVREPSEMSLTSGGISNTLPSTEQYGVQTVIEADDERMNVQSAAIRCEIRYANRRESHSRAEL